MITNALWEITCVRRYVGIPLAATHVIAALAMSWIEMADHAMVGIMKVYILKIVIIVSTCF